MMELARLAQYDSTLQQNYCSRILCLPDGGRMAETFYQQAHFLLSTPNATKLPADQGYDVAFAGRSNAGKSSAINCLTRQKTLARTSKTPGRTQHLVCFELDEHRRIIDLPGYGYAKVPEKLKRQWVTMVERYLSERQSLQGIVLMMDCRHPLKPFDEQMLAWQSQVGLPMHILLTKADKLKKGPANSTLLKVRQAVKQHDNVTAQLFSATKNQGLPEAYEVLTRWFDVIV